MLRTCDRCRSRKIKCDPQLPACANCTRSNVQCAFQDSGGGTVYRSYVKRLYDQVSALEAAVANKEQPGILLSPPGSNHAYLSSHESNQPMSFEINRMQQSSLASTPPVFIASAIISQLGIPDSLLPSPMTSSQSDRSGLHPTSGLLRRTFVTSEIASALIWHYQSNVYLKYPVSLEHVLEGPDHSLRLDILPPAQRCNILAACALAAIHKSYSSPGWLLIAQVYREWAGEIVAAIGSKPTANAFKAALLLLIYELMDLSRGMVYVLHDLAVRYCLELGWHRFENLETPVQGTEEARAKPQSDTSVQVQLMSVFLSLQRPLRMIFNRPSMLDNIDLSRTPLQIHASKTHAHFCDQLLQAGHVSSDRECFLARNYARLISTLDDYAMQDMELRELWLLFLPVCLEHRFCTFCRSRSNSQFQEASLQAKIVLSARDMIEALYSEMIERSELSSPLFASARALMIGCALAAAKHQNWKAGNDWHILTMKCTEILAICTTRWKGAQQFSDTWRSIFSVATSQS